MLSPDDNSKLSTPPSSHTPSVLGISFDGLAVSGIVNEYCNAASVFRRSGLRVLLDLGYDITLDRTRNLGSRFLPDWVEAINSLGDRYPGSYSPELVAQGRTSVLAGRPIAAMAEYRDACRQLSARLVDTFAREQVRLLIVENGTLPDNPLFTEALFAAIAEYGTSRGFGKFVLWRDHDLMWSTEPHVYGAFPYPGVRKPVRSPHICYVVTTNWMKTRMEAWAPGVPFHVIPFRFAAPPSGAVGRTNVRTSFGIPDDAYLFARCTRLVPQKSIERDLRLLHELQRRLDRSGSSRRVFLLVTGPTEEDPVEFDRLNSLAERLSIAGQVAWANGLRTFTASDNEHRDQHVTVSDVLREADISSFLTSYDYEGFGLPPGEAMAMGVPFISTTYELYHEVYGSKGAVAPLLPIVRSSPPDAYVHGPFVDWTLRVLMDEAYRLQLIERNRDVVAEYFSIDVLSKQLQELFAEETA